MLPPAPPFDPNVKKNQHYVPRLWQKRFANGSGTVFGRYHTTADPIRDKKPGFAGKARQVSVDNTMADDWIYTVFDNWWRPSNSLEDAISKDEARIAHVFDQITVSATQITADLRRDFCLAIGFAACRTPEIMARGHRRAKALASIFADIHSYSEKSSYLATIQTQFGVVLSDAEYEKIHARTREELTRESEWIHGLSPQDPNLPQQIALTGADIVARIIEGMELTLLEAIEPPYFVLGDTPLPDADLGLGFVVPISSKIALKAERKDTTNVSSIQRELVRSTVCWDVNRIQHRMSRAVVIGPDPAVLDAL